VNQTDTILAKPPEERTEEEKQFIIDHYSEITDEQKKQYMGNVPVIDNNIEEEITAENVGDINIAKETDAVVVKKLVTRQFSVEVKDLGENMLEAVVASDSLDRHGETIDMKGMNVKNYMKNPVVAWGHNYDEPAIAKTDKLTKTKDGKLIAKMTFASDIYDKAKTIYNLYKGGFMKAFSIGFIPEQMDGNRYIKSEMIEFSAVLVPANPEALLLAQKRGIDTDKLNCNNSLNMTEEEKAKVVADAKATEDALVERIGKTIDEKLIAAKSEMQEEIKKVTPVAVIKNINGQYKKDENGEVAKEEKFKLYVKGLMTHNFSEYLDVVGKDVMNTTDTGDVLPPMEFTAEVERLEEQYGVARQFCTIRTSTTGKGISFLMGNDDVELFDTAEAGPKQSTKLSYTPKTLLFRKFAAILPLTDELLEDSALDLWNDATNRFARKLAMKEDELVFTEISGVSPKNKGLLHIAGTNGVPLLGSYLDVFEGLDYDALSKAIWGVPTASEANGRFFLNREILGIIQRIKDLNGVPIWNRAMADGTPATILGKPYSITEILPKIADEDSGKGFIVFGDLKYVTLADRTGLNVVIRDTGSVGDPEEEDQERNQVNLFTQDMKAMRVVKRMNAVCRFPAAFSVIHTSASFS
jgi:HK97 family phage major capsid protein